jgi:hypothetical protein
MTEISYIELLRMAHESLDSKDKQNAELEKTLRKFEHAVRNENELLEMQKNQDIRDLEQQAKGVEDCLGIPVVKGDRAVSTMRLNSRVKKLKAQAKSLKEDNQ